VPFIAMYTPGGATWTAANAQQGLRHLGHGVRAMGDDDTGESGGSDGFHDQCAICIRHLQTVLVQQFAALEWMRNPGKLQPPPARSNANIVGYCLSAGGLPETRVLT
jgi:hypothetical protein